MTSRHLGLLVSATALSFCLAAPARASGASSNGKAKALLLVGDNFETQDAWYADRLAKSDFAVTVVSAKMFNPAVLPEFELAVISESVASSDLAADADAFKLPVVCLEPALFDDLGLTGSQWQRDYGDAIGQTQLVIGASEHPLTGGLTGSVRIAASGEKLVWARPRSSAIKIARLLDQSGGNRWAVFGYEAGADLGGSAAPARRVGFFAGRNVAPALTPSGWTLFDASVRWAARRRLLFVVGSNPPNASDQQLMDFLQRRFNVEVVVEPGVSLRKADFAGKRLVLISETTDSNDIKDVMPGLAQPAVVLEPAVFDDLGMTGPDWQDDFGDRRSQRYISIVDSTHVLAAGLTGTVNVINDDASKFVWGVPAAGAIKVANLAQEPNRYTIFAYERGTQMVKGRAPARRVGWFAGRDTPLQLNPAGVALFEQAIAWAGQLPFAGAPCSALTDPDCKGAIVTTAPINPVASQDVPGYDPGPHYGCEPVFAGGSLATDDEGRQYFQTLDYASDPAVCRAPANFCDENDNPVAAPTVEQLNSVEPAFLAPCGPLKGTVTENCGVDPRTLGQACQSSLDCPAGQVCATVCADGACTEVTRRCGSEYASCAAVPAEDDLCDVREIRECPDPRAVGEVFAEELEAQLQALTEEQPGIRVPNEDKPEINPFEELTGAFCGKSPAEERAEARQDKAPDTKQGNDQWGFFLSPTAQQRFKLSLKELADQTFETGGSAGLKAGAVLMGKKITAIEALLDVSLQHCGQQIGATLKIFGDAIASCDTIKGGCSAGFQNLEPTGTGAGTKAADSAACNSRFATRNQKAGDLRRALFVSRGVKEFYKQNGTTKNLCVRSNKELGLNQNCDDPNLINNIDIPNAWTEEYENAAKEFGDADSDFEFTKDKISGGGEVALLDTRHRFTAAATQISFMIGPVPVVLAFEAFGTWGLTGAVQYGLMYGGGLLELGANLTLPLATIMNDPADIRLIAGPVFTPNVSLNVAAFAGIGFSGLSLGIEGSLQLVSASLPLDARIVASRIGEPDPRDLASSDWAGEPIAGIPTNKVWKWKYGWAYGAHLSLEAMKGQIDAAVRVRFLFVKKTFRKRITKWKGYSKTFRIIGKEGGDPLTGADDLGNFVDKVAYTRGEPLTGAEVIARPNPDAFYPDVLGREECGIVVQ